MARMKVALARGPPAPNSESSFSCAVAWEGRHALRIGTLPAGGPQLRTTAWGRSQTYTTMQVCCTGAASNSNNIASASQAAFYGAFVLFCSLAHPGAVLEEVVDLAGLASKQLPRPAGVVKACGRMRAGGGATGSSSYAHNMKQGVPGPGVGSPYSRNMQTHHTWQAQGWPATLYNDRQTNKERHGLNPPM